MCVCLYRDLLSILVCPFYQVVPRWLDLPCAGLLSRHSPWCCGIQLPTVTPSSSQRGQPLEKNRSNKMEKTARFDFEKSANLITRSTRLSSFYQTRHPMVDIWGQKIGWEKIDTTDTSNSRLVWQRSYRLSGAQHVPHVSSLINSDLAIDTESRIDCRQE